MSTKPVYLPGLNGLRAIAALAVVVSHCTLALGELGLNSRILGTDTSGNASGLALAGYGVTIFFTLSGFLITYLLLKEKETGRLHVRDFYIRRILRIWPLYYVYLGLVLLTLGLYSVDYPSSALPFYVFLAANIPFIIGHTIPLLAHYWSLGVEEQFYLFFPQIAKLTNRMLLKLSVILIVLLLLLKAVFWIISKKYGQAIPLAVVSVTRFHTMLLGTVGAILYYEKRSWFIRMTTHKLTQALAWGCIGISMLNRFHIATVIDEELISIIALCLILGQITRTHFLINLENGVADFVGKISYGIYVIHPLVIFFFVRFVGRFESDSWYNYAIMYLSVIAVTLVLAYLSYEYYEKWFLRLKARFSIVRSASTRSEKEQ